MDLTVKKKLLLSFLGIALILGIWSIDRYGKGMDSNSVSKLSAANMDQISSSSENVKAAILKKENQLKENPGDANLRLELGNQYYDLASELQSSNPEEAVLDFNKAVTHYQEYLKTNNVLRVWVDLATAAYYGNDELTAENAFKKAIQIDSKDDQVHYKYGVFLFHLKKDYPGAVREWKTALALNPSSQDAERIKRLISGLEAEIAAGQGK